MPRRKINPETDACVRGHEGNWYINSQGASACRLCARQFEKAYDQRMRAWGRNRRLNLRRIYRVIPGAAQRAADLLHEDINLVQEWLNNLFKAPKWRITQLKAVLELCILTNGHKA